jgi:small subunit ribosomal protein S8
MHTDPIADYLTRIRNGMQARHRVVEIPRSNLKVAITKILFEKGYILSYKEDKDKGVQGTLKIALKYDRASNTPAIQGLRRVSRPGLRRYENKATLPKVRNGLGVAIVSTSRGVMSDKEARQLGIGGEVLCFIE